MKKPTSVKQCSGCFETKPLEEFYHYSCSLSFYSKCKICHNKRARKWAISNPKSCNASSKKWRSANSDSLPLRQKMIDMAKPWYPVWRNINTRCTNPNAINYKRYGGKGIRNYLSCNDVKFLWQKYHADDLSRPSIDRIDSTCHYTLNNSQFIELSENSKKRWREYREKRK